MSSGSPDSNVLKDAFAVERRERIRQLVVEHGRVRTAELARLLQVTEPTIRKDINDLEAQSLLLRTHGGAVARGSMAEVDLTEREQKFIPEKQRIARACYDMIEDGDAIFLDCGTTIQHLAQILASPDRAAGVTRRRDVKVITNSFKVAETMDSSGAEPPIVLGGRYRTSGGCFVGPLTIKGLEQFHVDIAFLGITGLTEDGLFVADLAEAEVKAAITQRAARVIIPMDHSKVGLTDFVRVGPIPAASTIVTDRSDPQLTNWAAGTAADVVITEKESPHE